LKKRSGYQKEEIPIYLRITVDGGPKELFIKRSWEPARWNSHAGRALGTKEDAKVLNTYLDTYQNKVYDAKRKLVESEKMITAEAIIEKLLGNDQRNRMLINIYLDFKPESNRTAQMAAIVLNQLMNVHCRNLKIMQFLQCINVFRISL
jgi:hypothetical protein